MKSLINLIIVFSLFQGASAQNKKKLPTAAPKVGYIFEDYILQNYDEVKKLEEVLKVKKENVQLAYNKLNQEYQNLYADYLASMKNTDSLTTEKLNEKLKKVQESKNKSDAFQRNAEKDFQEATSLGIMNIKNNISLATNKIAKEQAYRYVFYRNKNENLMTGQKTVLFCADKGQHNLSDAILLALGSKPPQKVPVKTK